MSNDNETLKELEDTVNYLFSAHLKSIYELTGLALKLHEIELELTSLNEIKTKCMIGKFSPDNVKPLDVVIEQKKKDKTQAQRILADTEKMSCQYFLEITRNLGEFADGTRQQLFNHLPRISTLICTTVEEKIKIMNESVQTLKDDTLSKASGEVMRQSLERLKKETFEVHRKNLQQVAKNNQKLFEDVLEKMEILIGRIEKDQIVSDIVKEMDVKLKKTLTVNKEKQEQENLTSQQMKETVKEIMDKELANYIMPRRLSSLVANLPQLAPLLDILHRKSPYANWIEIAPALVPIKNLLVSSEKDLLTLKQTVEEARSFLDALRLNYIGLNADSDVNQAAALANMQKIQNRAIVMQKNFRMVETALLAKQESLEINSLSRKRKKLNSDQDVNSRIAKIENKHQDILDFVVKRKDVVLGDSFSNILEDTMKKIEEKLENHTLFLSFMLDPLSTSQKRQPPPITDTSEQNYLSQPMIDYIQQLIKQATNEATAPLQEEIKSLQEQLNNKK